MRFSSHDEIKAAFKDEERRKQLVAEAQSVSPMWDTLVLRQVDSEANQKFVGKTLAEIAATRNTSTIDTMIDLSIEEDLQAHFLASNMGHTDNDVIGGLLANPRVHLGASDGGAHILSFSTYGDTGYLFSQFVRQCKALSIEEAVKKITLDTATIWGMNNRGLLHEGYAADITIFDAEQIDRGEEYYVQDVPGDGSRYVRDSKGIDTVIIGGEIAYRGGEYTESAIGSIIPGLEHA